MVEPGSDRIVTTLAAPAQCVLWDHPERLDGRFAAMLEEIETFQDSSHLSRALYRCRECGQRYFYEWYEWVDWEDGNDRAYTTLVPVQAEAEIDALRQTDVVGLMRYYPRLQWDGGPPVWNGKG